MIVKRVSELVAGDVIRAWEDGDPWTGTVVRVERRALPTRSSEVFWTYDVTYEGGHTAFSLNGAERRKVVDSRRCDSCDLAGPLRYSPEHGAHFCDACHRREVVAS